MVHVAKKVYTSMNNDGAVIVGKTNYRRDKLCFINVSKKDIQSYSIMLRLAY